MKRNAFIVSLLGIPAIPAIAVAVSEDVKYMNPAIMDEMHDHPMDPQVMTLSINGQEVCNSENATITLSHEPIEITNKDSNGWREFREGPRTLKAVF